MQIQVNTDNNIEGTDRLREYLTETIQDELSRFEEHITRIEVHLSDENGSKGGGNDNRCMLEARVENMKPIAVVELADTVEQSVFGATTKLKASLDTIFGRLANN
jgi:ribosome-associated translation inhibitor RaiA